MNTRNTAKDFDPQQKLTEVEINRELQAPPSRFDVTSGPSQAVISPLGDVPV